MLCCMIGAIDTPIIQFLFVSFLVVVTAGGLFCYAIVSEDERKKAKKKKARLRRKKQIQKEEAQRQKRQAKENQRKRRKDEKESQKARIKGQKALDTQQRQEEREEQGPEQQQPGQQEAEPVETVEQAQSAEEIALVCHDEQPTQDENCSEVEQSKQEIGGLQMNATAQSVCNFFDGRNINYTIEKDDIIVVPYKDDDTPPLRIMFIFDNDGKAVSLRCFSIAKLKDDSIDSKMKAFAICNALNQKWRWTKFFLDNDNEIVVQLDAVLDLLTAGEECLELISHTVGIIGNSYKPLMQAIWA